MEWSDIDIRIPTVVPQRAEAVEQLAADVYEETGTHARVSPQPPHRPSSDQVRRIFTDSVDGEWLLYLEDDARLAPTFADRVPKVLEQTDRRALSFFDTRGGADGLHTAPKPFYSTVCLGVHASISQGFVDYYYEWLDAHPEHDNAVDVAFGDYTTSLGEPIDLYRPSQVQHRPIPSTFDGRSTGRQSPSYERAYGS